MHHHISDCGNDFQNDAAEVEDGCEMPCAGDAAQTCGGPNRLTVFKLEVAPNGGETSGTTTTSTTTTSSEEEPTETDTSTTDPSTTDPTTTEPPTTTSDPGSTTTSTDSGEPTETGWNAKGCYTDDVGQRTLPVGMGVGGQNSHEACTSACYNAGYRYAGMEYSNECCKFMAHS